MSSNGARTAEIGSPSQVPAQDPSLVDRELVRDCCRCYDDYVHHHRLTFNMISNLVRDLDAAGYCGAAR